MRLLCIASTQRVAQGSISSCFPSVDFIPSQNFLITTCPPLPFFLCGVPAGSKAPKEKFLRSQYLRILEFRWVLFKTYQLCKDFHSIQQTERHSQELNDGKQRHAKEKHYNTLKARRTPRSQPPHRRLCQYSDKQKALPADQHQVPETQRNDCSKQGSRERQQSSPFYPDEEGKFKLQEILLLCCLLCQVFRKLHTKKAGHLEVKGREPHTDKLRHWKIWRPVLCRTQGEFAGWKSLGTERGKWRADSCTLRGHWSGGRMITPPAMATTVPAVVPEGHQSTLGWWEYLDVFFSLLRMSVIPAHRGLWHWWVLLASGAQSRAINRQSQVHLGQKSKEQPGWRNKIRKKKKRKTC